MIAELDNRRRLLKPEMFARVRYTGPARPVVTVPAGAIVQDERRTTRLRRADARRVRAPRRVARSSPRRCGRRHAAVWPAAIASSSTARCCSWASRDRTCAGLLPYALHHRLLTLILGLGLVALGLWSFQQLKIEAYPDISDTGVVVITVYPGNASEEVEQQVTIPIERALNNVPHVIARRSRTIFGLSVVELTFADGTDDYFARQLVLEKLRDVALPDGVTPTLGPLSTGISEFYRYVLEGDGLRRHGAARAPGLGHRAAAVAGRGRGGVVTFGGLVKQYQIEVDPLALEKYKLTIADVAQAVEMNNRNAGGALVSSGQQAMVVRGVGLIQSVPDIENIALKAKDGVPVLLQRHRPRVDWRGAADRHLRAERSHRAASRASC